MTQRKPPQPSKTAEVSLVRSSAAEYLTFVAASGQGGVEAIYADESIWLTQKMLAQLYDVNVRTVNEHLKKIFADSELQEDSVIRKFRITATDGKNYNTQHYKLPAIIAVGYKVNSERAVQFRKWATGVIEQFTIKAYVMDDERIKAGGSVLTDREVLQDAGKVSAEIAKAHAESEFEKYRIVQDRLFESDFDRLLKQIESGGKRRHDDA
ncbi:MAG: RhuM family protein [Burkholderiaceae bacterium]|nr:RhuM family protein [Burkholderiaceae bacterium]